MQLLMIEPSCSVTDQYRYDAASWVKQPGEGLPQFRIVTKEACDCDDGASPDLHRVR